MATFWAHKLIVDGDPATGRTLESHVVANANRNLLVDCDVVDLD